MMAFKLTSLVSVSGMESYPVIADERDCVAAIVFDDGFDERQQEDLGNIFAAAPELLEDLELSVQSLEEAVDELPHSGEYDLADHLRVQADRFRNTIAKARGEK